MFGKKPEFVTISTIREIDSKYLLNKNSPIQKKSVRESTLVSVYDENVPSECLIAEQSMNDKEKNIVWL